MMASDNSRVFVANCNVKQQLEMSRHRQLTERLVDQASKSRESRCQHRLACHFLNKILRHMNSFEEKDLNLQFAKDVVGVHLIQEIYPLHGRTPLNIEMLQQEFTDPTEDQAINEQALLVDLGQHLFTHQVKYYRMNHQQLRRLLWNTSAVDNKCLIEERRK